jgi:bacteriocin-like protein
MNEPKTVQKGTAKAEEPKKTDPKALSDEELQRVSGGVNVNAPLNTGDKSISWSGGTGEMAGRPPTGKGE